MERAARVRSGVQGFVFKGRAPLLLNPENCRQAGEKAASISREELQETSLNQFPFPLICRVYGVSLKRRVCFKVESCLTTPEMIHRSNNPAAFKLYLRFSHLEIIFCSNVGQLVD